MAVKVVLTSFRIKLAQDALPDRVSVCRIPEIGPFLHCGGGGGVGDGDELDLSLPVDGEVDRDADLVPPAGERVFDLDATILHSSADGQPMAASPRTNTPFSRSR